MKKDQISGAFWLFVALIVIWQSLQVQMGNYRSPGPGFIPFCVGLGMAVISVVIILRSIFLTSDAKLTSWLTRESAIRLGIVTIGLLLYAFLFVYLGFPLSTFFLLIFLLKGIEPQPWRISVPLAVGITASVYFLFRVFLKCELPRGILGI